MLKRRGPKARSKSFKGGSTVKAAGYIRVSSETQAEQGHSLDAQRTLLAKKSRGEENE